VFVPERGIGGIALGGCELGAPPGEGFAVVFAAGVGVGGGRPTGEVAVGCEVGEVGWE